MSADAEMMRAFIAVEIDETVRAQTVQLMDNLRKGMRHTGMHPKWVEPENLHVTMFFLGQTRPAMIERIKDELTSSITERPAFEAQFQSLGVFPTPKKPSVLWLGVDHGRRQFKELQADIVRCLISLRWEPDRKPFHPHLTLARIRSHSGAQAMMDVVFSHRAADCGVCPITKVVLFKSDLRPDGPVYTPLHTWPLKNA